MQQFLSDHHNELKILPLIETIKESKVPSNKCNFSSSFAQFSSFLYFFSLRRQSSIYQMTFQCPLWEFHLFFHSFIIHKTLYIQKYFLFHITRVMAQWQGSHLPHRRAGFNSPLRWLRLLFVSYLNSRHQWKNPKFHRYLYIKYICDVINQYLRDQGK